MASLTLLDLARLNGKDSVVGLIEENLSAAPEIANIPARTIRGTSYKTSLRVSYPGVGFRAANAATTPTASVFEAKLVECFILSGIVQVDKAVAMAYEDGPAALQAIESVGVMRSALIALGAQTYYGTVQDAKGFPGLQSIVNSALTFDATGSTANTGSSVYAFRRGPQDVQYVFGSNQTFDLSEWRVETLSNVASFIADLTAWVGLQCVNPNSVGCIKNLTTQSGKTLTDAMLAQLIALFPVGNKPDVIFMNRRSNMQLQTSRTVALYGQAGGGRPTGELVAPPPVEYQGIPIVVTDSISSTEAIR